MAILSNGKFYGFLCSVKATGRKLSNGVKEYVEDFVSGFAGHGWKLWEYIKGKWKLEIDSLVVRETMVVFELLIQKIRAVKGALGITQACGRIKTATLDESGQNWLVTIEDEMSFVAHDFIRCQDWTNGTLKGYWVEISEIRKIDGVDTIVIPVSEFTGGIGYTDGMEAVDPALSGMTTPAVSDEIVQFGNSENVNRQRAIYLHADEGGQPAIDILFGINSKSFAGCTKIRMGGDIPGTDGLKGFYCENGMIKGTDSTGHVVYCIYPDGTAEFGDGSARFATDRSGHIAGGAISWHWDASKNKYVCSMEGVVLTWDNLDEETKENLKGESGDPGTSLIFVGELSSAPENPQNGWYYRNTTDKKCYVYQDGAWYVMTEDGKNGLDGEGSISADLDDEMQSVACSLDGTVVSGLPVTTTFSMFYGTTELPLDSLSVGSITGVTATSDRSTGIVKVTAITAAVADVIRIPITGRVTYKGAQYERTLHLSINKVKPGENGEDGNDGKNAVIYSLQPSTNIIKRDANGNSDVSKISCRVMKTDGTSTVVSSLPVGYSMDYIIDSGNATSYTPDSEISVSGITNKIQFRLYNETSGVVLIDRETIAVVSDGIDGINGEDGNDGLSIIWKGDLSSAPANPEKNWVYRNTIDGIVYIYNGSSWVVMVADGQDGTDGTDGTDGLSVFITYHDSEDEPSRPTGSGTSGGWHTNATKDVVWISQKVASSASSGTWGNPIRFKGLPGKYTELRYKYAFGKPATPTGTNPAGWSLSPDREDITFSYSGDFTKDGDYYVSPSPTSHSSTYKQRVSFTTRRANQMIHIEINVSSEQNYDKGIVEALDTSYSSSNEHAWVGSGVTNAVVDIAVPTAGSHFVEIVYTKDGSGSSNEDRVKFRMLDPTTCWYSTAVIDGKTTLSWSEPVIFPTDSKTEEQVYLLAKSKRNVIDLPTSNEYVNEYIGDAPEYSSSKFYSAGNIVKYNNVYKVAIQAHSGIAPTNEAYWEDVLWWVDNPRGASETYPYEYTCERTLQDGKWGEYKNYHLFGHYGKDGEPGEDANLLPWVEDWNNNKTEIGGEYLVSPKIFSGTKDSDGKLTGIALGRDCITIDGEKRTGIFALDQDKVMFELDPLNKKYTFRGTIIVEEGTGGIIVGDKTFIENGKIVTDFIDVDTLEVTHLKGATGSFKRIEGRELVSGVEVTKCAIGFSSADGKMYFEGDMQHQGAYVESDGTKRAYRFLTADLWCRGDFGHSKMTTMEYYAYNTNEIYFHVYGTPDPKLYHVYPKDSGQPVDCIILSGYEDFVACVCDAAESKMITVINNSSRTKRVSVNYANGTTAELSPWSFKIFITGGMVSGVNNLFGMG